ncbi:DMT family transporter [Sinomonas atrocyanea]|jgi:drug/metabolite transporter (DMT)-like permease|uniref:DMT family transporter n=1 Tax=Sinomonas atrocyanea TaxID=37927 RepID=UPI00277E8258|nr:DMT family transporter [Sinomonas atrocyanea]MDQ0260926.1 drug/metabolite transporter (DMT)-like permease [Sinomonas atrocyanea]MDR6622119.1 drug/metabolite transporter (DMT)-like permease [Sinomonas atrocyanea]
MSRRAWVLFAAMSLIWGVPYLLIRDAVHEVSPAVVVFSRTAIGAVVLLPFARRGMRIVWEHRWPVLAFALLEMVGPWFLLSDAERFLTSSLAGLLIAFAPVLALVVARLIGLEKRIGRLRIAGLAVAVGGVAALGGGGMEAAGPWPVVEMMLVAVGYAIAPQIAATKLREVPALPMTAACLTVAAAISSPFALMSWPAQAPSALATGSLVLLGLLCTALAFLLFFRLIADAGPARATAIAYVNPVVALALGVALHGDPLTPLIGAGAVLVLAGTFMATRRSAHEAEPSPAGPAQAPSAQASG